MTLGKLSIVLVVGACVLGLASVVADEDGLLLVDKGDEVVLSGVSNDTVLSSDVVTATDDVVKGNVFDGLLSPDGLVVTALVAAGTLAGENVAG